MTGCFFLGGTGPVLLNVLLKFLEQAREQQQEDVDTIARHHSSGWLPSAASLQFGCGCVLLLGMAAVLKVCACHLKAQRRVHCRQTSMCV